jgi:hypothetical protein
MIVNGTRKFVGSDRGTGKQSITMALTQPAEVGCTLSLHDATAPGTIAVAYELSQIPTSSRFHLALVERGIVRDIGAGENTGRRLHHDNVVRAFTTIDLGTETTRTIDLQIPADVVRQRASVIGYVQHADSMRILGAAKVDLR